MDSEIGFDRSLISFMTESCCWTWLFVCLLEEFRFHPPWAAGTLLHPFHHSSCRGGLWLLRDGIQQSLCSTPGGRGSCLFSRWTWIIWHQHSLVGIRSAVRRWSKGRGKRWKYEGRTYSLSHRRWLRPLRRAEDMNRKCREVNPRGQWGF